MAERQPAPIGRLIAAFRRLPGIGEKTATRLSYFLLAAPDTVAEELGNALLRLCKDVVLCDECFNLTEVSPCEVCRDPERSAAQLCVVEEPADATRAPMISKTPIIRAIMFSFPPLAPGGACCPFRPERW